MPPYPFSKSDDNFDPYPTRHNKNDKSLLKSGVYSNEEISTLIYLILKQMKMTSISTIVFSKVSWSAIGEEMLRTEKSVFKVWKERIYPVLAMHLAGKSLVFSVACNY